jgi:site-specific DNA-methyltransferase (adenine-specific)
MSAGFIPVGPAQLYLGDCQEILGSIEADILLTDPPYGQNQKVNIVHAGNVRAKLVKQRSGNQTMIRPRIHKPIIGDDKPFDPRPLLGIAPHSIIWGAHKFGHLLPKGSLLVWDKLPTGKVKNQGDGEAAWLSIPDRPLRIFRLLWDGFSVGKGARHEVTAGQQRLHPMQKPEAVMAWCLQQLPIRSGTIFDPYMGSGSTAVAALRLGFNFIGCEIDPDYFEIARLRIQRVVRELHRSPGFDLGASHDGQDRPADAPRSQ